MAQGGIRSLHSDPPLPHKTDPSAFVRHTHTHGHTLSSPLICWMGCQKPCWSGSISESTVCLGGGGVGGECHGGDSVGLLVGGLVGWWVGVASAHATCCRSFYTPSFWSKAPLLVPPRQPPSVFTLSRRFPKAGV